MAPTYVASRPGGVSGRSEEAVLAVRRRSHLVVPWSRQLSSVVSCFGVPAALAGEGLVIPTGPCSRGSPPYFLQLGALHRGSSVSDGMLRRLWRRVVASSSESERCELLTVSHSFLLLRCSSEFEVCGWFGWCVLEGFSQSGALVVLVEVLPGPACVASAILLAAVFSLMVCVVWSFGLCILVKVLPRIALCRFWWRFFPGVLRVCVRLPLCFSCGSKCAVWLGRVLVRFSQDGSWRFLVEVLPKAALCCFGCRCSLSL
ncbi:hypothetical protein Taro_002070 [Colocasia esculenta]|uniref:Uncharacterized protein n=1 Tax=Colocasia esculenta TaxID=4460 RepID=A0A843THS0_COLES|nr:hypothetical protein [Colocasia esculenta]